MKFEFSVAIMNWLFSMGNTDEEVDLATHYSFKGEALNFQIGI